MQLVKMMIIQLDYPYFKKHYKLIAQQKPGADPKAIQQNNFTGNLTRVGGARMYFIIEGAKSKSIFNLFQFNKILI